jgi:hypothetical protein
MDMDYPAEWKLVTAAVEQGDDADDGLQTLHLERAVEIRVDPDGSVIFKVERHPHLLGRPSRGQASSAFVRQLKTYQWKQGEGIRVIDTKVLDREFNAELLADEEFALVLESGELNYDDVPDLSGRRTETAAREAARRFAVDFLGRWTIDYSNAEGEVSASVRSAVESRLMQRLTDDLVGEWRTRHEGDE